MYEKTIAGEHRIYNITIGTAPTTVYDLLGLTAKQELDNILKKGLVVQGLTQYTINNHRDVVRVPVDGYVYSSVGSFFVSTSQTGDLEEVTANIPYPIPVYFWPFKTWLSSTSPILATVHIFFS